MAAKFTVSKRLRLRVPVFPGRATVQGGFLSIASPMSDVLRSFSATGRGHLEPDVFDCSDEAAETKWVASHYRLMSQLSRGNPFVLGSVKVWMLTSLAAC